jgi:hypothetical protein
MRDDARHVDGEPDADSEDAWAAEIERRAARALAGESHGKEWATVRAELEANRRRKFPPPMSTLT